MLSFFIQTDSFFWVYVLIPLLIFLARITDVTLGTIRIVFVSKGYKFLAPILGFFEVFIWLVAMSKIFENLDNWFYYIAYAGGFAAGNYVGLLIEERMAIGFVNIRIVTKQSGEELAKVLTEKNYGITRMNAQGAKGEVSIIFCITKRKAISKVVEIIKNYNPKAFYTIEDVRFVNLSYLPKKRLKRRKISPLRKGK